MFEKTYIYIFLYQFYLFLDQNSYIYCTVDMFLREYLKKSIFIIKALQSFDFMKLTVDFDL